GLQHVPAHRLLPEHRRRAPRDHPSCVPGPPTPGGGDRAGGRRGGASAAAAPQRPAVRELHRRRIRPAHRRLRAERQQRPVLRPGQHRTGGGLRQDLRAALCESYFGKVDPRQFARMNLFALMSDVGWTLWGAIQAKISRVDYDFRGYYTGRWERALDVLRSDRLQDWMEAATKTSD